MPAYRAVLEAITQHARVELEHLEQVHEQALDEATSAESKAENKYDTRSLEASYLARGQAERILALRREVAFFQRASEQPQGPPLLAVEEEDRTRWFLLAPLGGGRRVEIQHETVFVLTPQSPLGRQLVDAWEDDEIQLPGTRRVAAVVACYNA